MNVLTIKGDGQLNFFQYYNPYYGNAPINPYSHFDYGHFYNMDLNYYGNNGMNSNVNGFPPNMYLQWSPTDMNQNFNGNPNPMNSFSQLNQRTDFGPEPFVVDINEATEENDTYRTALWTGEFLQVTLMSINPGEDIGLEIHPDTDQFLRIEEGEGIVQMGANPNALNFVRRVADDSAIMVPAGTWHNVRNTGNTPLRLYSIYAPPHHPHGTIHRTKADAIAAEQGFYP